MALSLANRVVGKSGDVIDGIQIARDGEHIVYYYEDKVDVFQEHDPKELDYIITDKVDEIAEKLGMVNLTVKQRLEIESDILANEVPRSREGKRIYSKIKDQIGVMEYKSMITNDSFQVVPAKIRNQNNRIYIFGPSGCGKSTWASRFAKEYLKDNPGNNIFIFSRKDYDPVFDDEIPGLIRVKLDINFVRDYRRAQEEDDPINKYANSLVIFDDFLKIDEPTIRKTALRLKNAIFELSRQYGTDIISIMHKGLGGANSIVELTESNMIVCFPRKNKGETQKVLKTYCCFDREQMSRVLDKEGCENNWMCIRRPDTIIAEKYIKIID